MELWTQVQNLCYISVAYAIVHGSCDRKRCTTSTLYVFMGQGGVTLTSFNTIDLPVRGSGNETKHLYFLSVCKKYM